MDAKPTKTMLYETNEDFSSTKEFESLNSVKITRGAKGDVSIEVKCYGQTIQEAEAEATAAFARLTSKYRLAE